jgi:NADH-quinone oxidoreductase subunit K
MMVLVTSILLFALGVFGLLLRRSPMGMLMAVELMLNAGNLVLVLAARRMQLVEAQAAALLVLVLAAAEAVVGLGLALVLFRDRERSDADELREVQG